MIATFALIAACRVDTIHIDGKVRRLSPDGQKLLIAFEDPRSLATVRQIIDVPSNRVTHTWFLDRIVYEKYVSGLLLEQVYVLWAEDSQSFFEFKTRPAKNQSVKVKEIVLTKPEDPIEYPELKIEGPVRPKFWLRRDQVTASSNPVGVRVNFWSWNLKDPENRKHWMIQAPTGHQFHGYEISADNTHWLWNVQAESQIKSRSERWTCTSKPYGVQFVSKRNLQAKAGKSRSGKSSVIYCGPECFTNEMP